MALLGKWKWRFFNEELALWNKVTRALHGANGGFVSSRRPNSCIGVGTVLFSIVKISVDLVFRIIIPSGVQCLVALKRVSGMTFGATRRKGYQKYTCAFMLSMIRKTVK